MMSHFSLGAFEIFPLSLTSTILIMMYLGIDLFAKVPCVSGASTLC